MKTRTVQYIGNRARTVMRLVISPLRCYNDGKRGCLFLIFSQKECDLLVKCLNAYLADDEAHTEFGGTVITSALNKLNNINAMTMFTRKEFSAMCTSMYYIEEVYDFGNLETLPGFSSSLPGGFYHLMQKTNRLCDAL